MTSHLHRTAPAVTLLTLGALALAACAPADDPAAVPAAAAAAASSVTMADPWVKAADEGMSAAFGRITNDGTTDVTVVGAASPAATAIELHETVDDGSGAMTMREVDGGFVVPAGESVALEPGGDHLMLMGLTGPLETGAEVTITLTFSDDSTTEISAPVKDYSGANESYYGDDTDTDTDMDMDMDGGDHGDLESDHEHTVDEDS
ncbi:hypothetical protein ATJ88_2314 [Isoptericola jiangsuensis]|uniref:Copper(I)-binding protein n=1 Tax=Isoptericola jiangsuensis TaxID=548579 RepID=A0A2A9EXJ2_9MICO|nr:copper chaperone PCu(A)C [Isoptericola jiangsuensis]PFG43608.1 hypothetical protein ATJ88_2314 [Isoptericola jiangsuensis]